MSTTFLILTGATASGKSVLVDSLLAEYGDNCIIVNADCKQVYSEIPIVTAQPLKINKSSMYLYGYLSVVAEYNVFQWLSDVRDVLTKTIYQKRENNIVVFVGGSTMYLECLSEGISHIPKCKDETINILTSEALSYGLELFKKKYISLHPNLEQSFHNNKKNCQSLLIKKIAYLIDFNITIEEMILQYPRKKLIEVDFHYFILDRDRTQLYNNINKRVLNMLDEHVIDEINTIRIKKLSTNAYTAHGVAEFLDYLNGKLSLQEAISATQQKTRNYAKRQITWIRNKIKEKTYIKNEKDLIDHIKKLRNS